MSYPYPTKQVAEYLPSIGISWLKKNGYFDNLFVKGQIAWRDFVVNLHVSTWDDQYLEINYSLIDEVTKAEIPIKDVFQLVTTHCHFGGVRLWICCPDCRGMVSKLYKSGNRFKCRNCLNLTYKSRIQSNRGLRYQMGRDMDFREKLWHLKRYKYRGKPTKKVLILYRRYGRTYNPLLPPHSLSRSRFNA